MQSKRISGNRTAEDVLRKHFEKLANQPKEQNKAIIPPPVDLTPSSDVFMLRYDDFGRELIKKSNELFQGTKAEIPIGKAQEEVPNMYILKRLALITAIYTNQQLKSTGLMPIAPLQSEQLLKQGKLPKDPKTYWEDLSLILYDRSENGENPKEAQALYESLKNHILDLRLSASDLESRLLIINSGIEKDQDMPHGVKPIVLPGFTQVYLHETLKRKGDHKFEYGLEHGLPSISELGTGSRILCMPPENKDIGLKVLSRGRVLVLDAWYWNLVNSYSDGRVAFARENTT